MPRNLHCIKIPRLFSCQRSLNHTLGSSELKMYVKMGRHIRAGGDQGRLAWNWEGWGEFGEVLGDLEKGYQRWG